MESTGRHLNFVYNHQERSSPILEIFNASSGSGFGPSQILFLLLGRRLPVRVLGQTQTYRLV